MSSLIANLLEHPIQIWHCTIPQWNGAMLSHAYIRLPDVCSIWLITGEVYGTSERHEWVIGFSHILKIEFTDASPDLYCTITGESSQRFECNFVAIKSSSIKRDPSLHHGNSTAASAGYGAGCENCSQWGYDYRMQWLHGKPCVTNPPWVPHAQWGSLHSILLEQSHTLDRLGESERGILEPNQFRCDGLVAFGMMNGSKICEWWGLVGAAGVRISGTGKWGLSLLTSARRQSCSHESPLT